MNASYGLSSSAAAAVDCPCMYAPLDGSLLFTLCYFASVLVLVSLFLLVDATAKMKMYDRKI